MDTELTKTKNLTRTKNLTKTENLRLLSSYTLEQSSLIDQYLKGQLFEASFMALQVHTVVIKTYTACEGSRLLASHLYSHLYNHQFPTPSNHHINHYPTLPIRVQYRTRSLLTPAHLSL